MFYFLFLYIEKMAWWSFVESSMLSCFHCVGWTWFSLIYPIKYLRQLSHSCDQVKMCIWYEERVPDYFCFVRTILGFSLSPWRVPVKFRKTHKWIIDLTFCLVYHCLSFLYSFFFHLLKFLLSLFLRKLEQIEFYLKYAIFNWITYIAPFFVYYVLKVVGSADG